MSSNNCFTKDNLDTYLKELAKEFRKLNGTKTPAEIILIGGAAILANYGFRNMTTDVDAIINASSAMKDAITRVGNKYNLTNDWLNTDFKNTSSYTTKLNEVSVYYRTYSNILQIRTVSAEYLIAMKLCSGRKYKNDLSDIIGILAEHEHRNEPITLEAIDMAVNKLYNGWDNIPADSKTFIENAINNKEYQQIYETIKNEEKISKDTLIQFEQEYPNVANQSNVNDILKTLKSKQKK